MVPLTGTEIRSIKSEECFVDALTATQDNYDRIRQCCVVHRLRSIRIRDHDERLDRRAQSRSRRARVHRRLCTRNYVRCDGGTVEFTAILLIRAIAGGCAARHPAAACWSPRRSPSTCRCATCSGRCRGARRSYAAPIGRRTPTFAAASWRVPIITSTG